MSHTPGPWEWWTSNSWRRLRHSDRGVSTNVLLPTNLPDGCPDIIVTEADMALIAAAPDLLAALRASGGYLMNALIDLNTGAPKKTAIRTIEGGLKVVNDAIAKAEVGHG